MLSHKGRIKASQLSNSAARTSGARFVFLKGQLARLERAIGVIYRPDTERESHYFHATLPQQCDEYIWFDETHAVTPLQTRELKGLPDTYPFGI